jgi:histidinol-phosphatase
MADTADRISMPRFRARDLRTKRKLDGTPVTEVDLAVDNALRAQVQAAYPHDAFCGEEFGQLGDGRRVWMIDPVDGTAAFISGAETWSTLIGLSEDGLPVAGVVCNPARGLRWWGAVDVGAWRAEGDETRAISVSARASLSSARLDDDPRGSIESRLAPKPVLALADLTCTVEPYADFRLLRVAEGALDSDLWLASNGLLHDQAMAVVRSVIEAETADPTADPDRLEF